MNKLLIALLIAAAPAVYAAEPVYAKTTPNPVVVPESNEKQKVCIKDEKTGKETCKMMKIHKKLEGTPVPTKK